MHTLSFPRSVFCVNPAHLGPPSTNISPGWPQISSLLTQIPGYIHCILKTSLLFHDH